MVNNTRFEEFEKQVMVKLLDGDDETLQILRKQYEKGKISKREFSGIGFFTMFDVPDDVPRLNPPKDFHFGDIVVQMDGVKDGVGFVLFVKKGVINMLEGYTYGEEKWPELLSNYQISFISGKERDIRKIGGKWK